MEDVERVNVLLTIADHMSGFASIPCHRGFEFKV